MLLLAASAAASFMPEESLALYISSNLYGFASVPSPLLTLKPVGTSSAVLPSEITKNKLVFDCEPTENS